MGQGNCVTVLSAQWRLHVKVVLNLERLLRLWDEENSVDVVVGKAISAFQRKEWNLF